MNYDEKPLLLNLPETCSEVVSLNQLVHLGLLFDSTGKLFWYGNVAVVSNLEGENKKFKFCMVPEREMV
jgi:hypothetical protein